MASTYSDLKIELIGTGEQAGTWGSTTNTNLGTAIEEAITGSADVTFSSADVTVTLSNTNSSQIARNLRLVCTGTSGGARNLILGSGCQIEKLYLIQNGLADTVTVKNTTGTGVAVLAGRSQFVFNDGTNVVEATNGIIDLTTDVTGTLPVANGGTGQTSYTDGQLLIGTTAGSTLTKATLTGTANRLTVTNGAGSITLNVDAATANTANKVVARDDNGDFSAGVITADLTGDVSGNAGTATALQTARTINGTNFDGSANITTTNWGSSRTITIGATGKSVNGSANVSWSLSEIGVSTDLGAVGTYALLAYAATGTATSLNHISYLASGTTVAGSSLRRSSVTTLNNSPTIFPITSLSSNSATDVGYALPNSGAVTTPNTTNTTAMTGTWRLIGGNIWNRNYNTGDGAVGRWPVLIWVRIS